MSAKLRVLTASILIVLPLAARALERSALLPPNAQAHMRVSNTTNFLGSLKLSSIGKLWADPQVQDFLGNPGDMTWEELLASDESNEETSEIYVEQFKMLRGELLVAFDMDGEDPYIIAAMSKDAFLRSLELDDQMAKLPNAPFEISKSTFQDVEIIQHIQNGGTPEEDFSWQAHVNNTLVMGESKEWVEKSIVQLQKAAPEEPTGNPVFTLSLPLDQLIQEKILKGMKEEVAQSPTPAPYDPEVLLEALGVLGVENFHLKIELKDSEMLIDSNLRVSDLTKGLFTILDVKPVELPTVTFIPEDIASIEVGRFNLLRFWQEIPNVLATAMPAVKPQFDMIMGMVQQQAGINLEQDLLANLDTKYVSFAVADDDKQTSVIAIGLKDSAAFKTGLETALAAPGLQSQVAALLEIEPFLDHTIYTPKNAAPEEQVSFGVAGGYLLYGQPDGLRQVIRSESSEEAANTSFEQSALVKGLRAHVPTRAFGYSAIDWKKNMDLIIREFSKPEYTGLMQQGWADSGSPLPPPDFTKLPPADHIAEFFNVSYQYIEATNDGLHQQIILKY